MPHVRNGHTWIANELIDQVFAKGKFSKRESQIIWVILRQSWGWLDKRPKTIKKYGQEKRKYKVTMRPISCIEFSKKTGIALPHVGKTIRDLKIKKIVNEHFGYYKFNKNYNGYQKGNAMITKKVITIRDGQKINKHFSLEKKLRTSTIYRVWREGVLSKDNCICQRCKIKSEYGIELHTHHKSRTFAEILEQNKIKTYGQAINCFELWDTNNGQTLCLKCHNLISRRNNDFTSLQNKNLITRKAIYHSQNSKPRLPKRKPKVTETVTPTNPKDRPKGKQRGLKESKESLNKERKMIRSQITNLMLQFPDDLKMLIDDYIENARMENKTREITLNKHQRLLNELWDAWLNCNIDILKADFKTALRITVNKQAPNINYLKKVMKNIANKRALRMKENINGDT